MKPNTTGLPQTGDYNLGRGRLYGAVLNTTTGRPDVNGWRDLGNAPSFAFSIEEETLDHKSSREGTGTVDKQVSISKKITVSFSLDEINAENLALFFSGEKSSYTNPAVGGVAEQVAKYTDVVLGRWYDLTKSDGTRIMGVDSADVLLEKDDTMDVTLVEGTDYVFDGTWGRFFLKTTAVNIAAGDDVNLTVTLDAMAPTPINQVFALTQTPSPMALKFIGVNPANGDEESEVEVHQIIVKADGDFSLIGDDWTVMQFTGVAEANNIGYPTSPYITISTHSEA